MKPLLISRPLKESDDPLSSWLRQPSSNCHCRVSGSRRYLLAVINGADVCPAVMRERVKAGVRFNKQRLSDLLRFVSLPSTPSFFFPVSFILFFSDSILVVLRQIKTDQRLMSVCSTV